MDPDSDSEVKLLWPDGETSGYIKIDRLEYVGEGRHSSHRHTLAPCERRGWNCDVWCVIAAIVSRMACLNY